METKRTFLITGATGFVGANLCRRLAQDREEVHAFLSPWAKTWRLDDIRNALHLHEVDLRDDNVVKKEIESIRPTVIYHLATYGAYHYQEDPERILLTNVMGSWNLLSACCGVGYELFVNTGTSSEYGKKAFARRETDLLEPDSTYAVAKSAQTLLSQYIARKANLPIVTFRIFSAYGPYEEPTRLMPRLMMAAIDNAPIDMVSPRTGRDFIYIDDVVDAYLRVDSLKENGGQTFNLGTGIQSTLMEAVEIVSELRGARIDARWGTMQPRIWDTDVWVADISKIRRTIGWAPSVGLREGLKRCLDWIERHRFLYETP